MTNVLDALLDSWDRNNVITTNLLRLVPDDAMDLKPIGRQPVDRSALHAPPLRAAGVRARRRAGVREADAER